MSFKTLILAILTLTACKTPAQRSESSVQGLADDIDLSIRALQCEPQWKGSAYFNLVDTTSKKVLIGELAKMTLPACKEAMTTVGRGGACFRKWNRASLVRDGLTAIDWTVTKASPAEVIWAECLQSARLADDQPDVYGHQGLKCQKTSGATFDLIGKNGPLAHGLLFNQCVKIAEGARNGLACVPRPIGANRTFPFAIVDVDTQSTWHGATLGMDENRCFDIVRTSGPGGICYLLDDAVQFKQGPTVVKTWKNAQRSPSELDMCQQMAAVPRGPLKANPVIEVEPAPVRTEFKGVVSQNPTFLPGTAKARLFVQVEGAELLVTVDNATKIELGTRDLSQLVGMSVVVEGTDAGNGELVATRIREAI